MKKKKLYLILLSSLLLTSCNNEKNIIDDYETYETIEDENIKDDVYLEEEQFNNEEEVVNYFSNLKEDIEILLNTDYDFKEEIEEKVMTFVNFITTDIKIGGYDFKSLKEESKIAIKTLYVGLDQKIEQLKPNYKEDLILKSKQFKEFSLTNFEIIKEEVIGWYNDGTLKENIYNKTFGRIDDDLSNMKDTFSSVFNKAKEKVKK